MNKAATDALEILRGLRLRRIARAADLLKLAFGEVREIPARNGGMRQVCDWTLHIQTPWRFTRDSRILLGVRDLYFYADSGEDFDWGKDGESRFDRLAAALNSEFDTVPTQVSSVLCDSVGSFSLGLSTDLHFDVFPNGASTSSDFEFWRLFQPGTNNPHFVVATDVSKVA